MTWKRESEGILTIQAFIFDIDGTLLDSVKAHAESWVETFAAFRKNVPLEETEKLIGTGGDQFLKDYFSKEELTEKVCSKVFRDVAEIYKEYKNL